MQATILCPGEETCNLETRPFIIPTTSREKQNVDAVAQFTATFGARGISADLRLDGCVLIGCLVQARQDERQNKSAVFPGPKSTYAHLFGLGEGRCYLSSDLGQAVDDALHYGSVTEVLERVTSKLDNLGKGGTMKSMQGKAGIRGSTNSFVC